MGPLWDAVRTAHLTGKHLSLFSFDLWELLSEEGEEGALQQVQCFDIYFPGCRVSLEGVEGKCSQLMEAVLGNWAIGVIRIPS